MSKIDAGKAEESILAPYMGEMSDIFNKPSPDKDEALQFVEKIDQKIEDSKIIPGSKAKMHNFLQDFRETVEEGVGNWSFKFMKWFTDAILRKGGLGVVSELEGAELLTKEGKKKVVEELNLIANFLQEVRNSSLKGEDMTLTKEGRQKVVEELNLIASMLDQVSQTRKKSMETKVAEELDEIANLLQSSLQSKKR
jgi:hypothetical protein